MAVLYIAEFTDLPVFQGNSVPAPRMPPVAEQTVAIGAETDSAAFNAKTRVIRVHADAICSIVIGTGNPAATTSNMRLAANSTEYFSVRPDLDSGLKLSVVTNT